MCIRDSCCVVLCCVALCCVVLCCVRCKEGGVSEEESEMIEKNKNPTLRMWGKIKFAKNRGRENFE